MFIYVRYIFSPPQKTCLSSTHKILVRPLRSAIREILPIWTKIKQVSDGIPKCPLWPAISRLYLLCNCTVSETQRGRSTRQQHAMCVRGGRVSPSFLSSSHRKGKRMCVVLLAKTSWGPEKIRDWYRLRASLVENRQMYLSVTRVEQSFGEGMTEQCASLCNGPHRRFLLRMWLSFFHHLS